MRAETAKALKVSAAILALFLSAACGGSGQEQAAPRGGAPVGAGPDLRSVCPSPTVVQTSWIPDAVATGGLYHLLGPDPDIDAEMKRVRAPLTVRGENTGVDLEIRAGGPAIGFTPVSAQLYLDRSITLGLPKVDEQIQLSSEQPTLAVLALFEIDPQMVFWDPERHPDFKTIADIGETDTTVLYIGGDTYMEYLTGSGVLKASQVDGSQDGSPARFIASEGEIAQTGYAVVQPYFYERELREWGKPVRYQLVYEVGYPNYGEVLALRAGDKDALAPCLERLVPIVQQAQVDVMASPERVIDLTLRLNQEYDLGIPFSRGISEFGVATARSLGLVGDGGDGVLGNFDEARIRRMLDITTPIFAAARKPARAGLAPSDLYTNEFIEQIGIGTPR